MGMLGMGGMGMLGMGGMGMLGMFMMGMSGTLDGVGTAASSCMVDPERADSNGPTIRTPLRPLAVS